MLDIYIPVIEHTWVKVRLNKQEFNNLFSHDFHLLILHFYGMYMYEKKYGA